MTSRGLLPTFRDPAGSLEIQDACVVRRIAPAARADVLAFLASPFRQRLEARGDLIAATVDDGPDGLTLLHPKVPIPTYPWEWTWSQWLAAAELTLTLAKEALADGWTLKDATPLNMLFLGSRPVLVDFLSFERRDPAASLWLAYGQYVRTFLLPLVMDRLLGWPLALTMFRRDGYEPAELYAALSWPQRLSSTAFWPITLPALMERRKGADAAAANPQTRVGGITDPEFTAQTQTRTLNGLLERTRRTVRALTQSQWSDYTSSLTHYTLEQSGAKRAWVRMVLERERPRRVLDIGANTGEFSALAAESGAQVVALERDAAAAERIYRMSAAGAPDSAQRSIQTMHADFARPTPAVGWDNHESSALLDRLEGQFDLVLMLAVIHHLILMEQIPIAAVLSLVYRLTTRFLVVEWVPPADPMYRSLMRGRFALYGTLSEADLHRAVYGLFMQVERKPLSNGRVLLLFEKRP